MPESTCRIASISITLLRCAVRANLTLGSGTTLVVFIFIHYLRLNGLLGVIAVSGQHAGHRIKGASRFGVSQGAGQSLATRGDFHFHGPTIGASVLGCPLGLKTPDAVEDLHRSLDLIRV